MKISVTSSTIEGELTAPPSKSVMQRLIAAALLAEDQITEIQNPSSSADCLAALGVARALGAEVTHDSERILIRGGLSPAAGELSCGESGLCMRMFAPIAALCPRELVLVGEGTLRTRPMEMLIAPLTDLGVECTTARGHQPLSVRGPLKGGRARVDGSLSSQVLTGLLMALPRAETASELQVDDLVSRGYVDLTLKILEDCGVRVTHEDYSRFSIAGGQRYAARRFTVEGDWSGAAFLCVAAAIRGRLSLNGLELDSLQPDRKILDVLEACGANVSRARDRVMVERRALEAFELDVTDCPDLVPPLAALACSCDGTSRLTGMGRLRYKESDRAAALLQELSRLGIAARIDADVMEIEGGELRGGGVQSHADHRIAMALAVLGLNAERPVVIEGASCVRKSYPGFFEDLASIGGELDE